MEAFDENQLHEDIEQNENDTQYINGRVLTYKTGEVADILGETPAMIRYYCREFNEYLSLEHIPGEHRNFTQKNIEELKYILDLINKDHLSVKQIHEFLSSPEGRLAAPIFDQQEKIKELITIMVNRVDTELQTIVKRELENTFTPILKDALSSALDTLPSKTELENINKNVEEFKNNINETFEKKLATKEDLQNIELNMEQIIDKKIKENANNSKDGLFKRLINKIRQ